MQRRVNALATVRSRSGNAIWRVRFFRIISVQYFILDLDPAYQWVMVGHPSRRYGWIMARSKALDESLYQGILRRTAGQGYDPGRFKAVPQRPTE
jgi:apolipoprotein D and lipocalin family protein